MKHLPPIARGGGREASRRGATARWRRVTIAVLSSFTAALLLLASHAFSAAPEPSRAATDPGSECRRQDGTLSRYLLCREIAALRPGEARRYYALLERADGMVLRGLAGGGKLKKGAAVLRRMHAVGKGATVHRRTDLLVDLFDGWEARCGTDLGGSCGFEHADCDLLSLLNYGSSERYYGESFAGSGFSIVRTEPAHVITAFASGGRVTSALETTDGSIVSDFRGIFRRDAVIRARKHGYLRPMKESEIIAMHLASIGLRLMDERRHAIALSHFDEALALNEGEFLAHAGRSQALLTQALEPLVLLARSRDCARAPWAPAEDRTPLLDEAERSIRWVLASSDEYHYAHYLLGILRYARNDLPEARRSFRAAARRQARPVYLYSLGLTELRLGMQSKAIRSLSESRRRMAEPDRDAGPDLELSSADLALALAFKMRAEQKRSYTAARRGARSVARALDRGAGGPCELLLRDQLLVLQARLAPLDWGFPVRALAGGSTYSADLSHD